MIGLVGTGSARGSRLRQFREMNPVPIGVAFLVGLVLMVFLALNINKLPFTAGTTYSAAFGDAAGLRPGDEVRVAGVVVGRVTGVSLQGDHVRVRFTVTNGHLHLGTQTIASIQIFTLLGNKYLALLPAGPGRWDPSQELPRTRTETPYDVEPALQDLASTAGRIDTAQLAHSFDTIAATFKNSPPALRSMLSGLSRLSETIASRDAALAQLLGHADAVTGVLADRHQQFVQILSDGDLLLQMLEQRRAEVGQLLTNTALLSQQLTGLVHDNQATLQPMLAHLHGVAATLDANQANLDEIIRRLYVFVRGEVDATGSGPWFDGTAINVVNPFTAGGQSAPLVPGTPHTLGDLLGVAAAQAALGGRR